MTDDREDYILELQSSKYNYSSNYLNAFAFFIPIYGFIKGFCDLLRKPKKAKGILLWSMYGLCIQLSVLFVMDKFLFAYVSDFLPFVFF